MKKLLWSTSIILFSLTTGLYAFQIKTSDPVILHQVTDYLFEQALTDSTINLHYTLAEPEAFGLKDLPITLGSYSVGELEQQGLLAESALHKLSSLSQEKLTMDDRLTYNILTASLQQQLQSAAYSLYPEPLSTQGVLTELPVLLSEYTFRKQADVEDYLSLIDCVPSYLEELIQYEKDKAEAGLFMSDTSLQMVLDRCQALCAEKDSHFLRISFDERLELLDSVSDKDKDFYRKENDRLLQESFFPAYQSLSEALRSLQGKGQNPYGLCYFEKGKEYYAYLAASSTGTDYTPEDMKQLLLQQMKEDYSELKTLLQSNPSLSEAVSELDTSLNLSESLDSPESMLLDLYQKTAVSFPVPYNTKNENAAAYQLKYVDASLESFLSPAFYLTPPMDLLSENTIYINNVSSYSDISLYTTLAHEGYPGHMLQNTYFLSMNPVPIRALLYFGGYSEGWAVYTEQYAYTLAGLSPDLARVLQLDHSIQLCICSLLDIMIHYEGLTPEQLAENSKQMIPSIDEASLSALYQQIVDEPANYLKYCIGYLEICRLRTHAEQTLGDRFREKEFHEFLLCVGPAPFPIIKEREDVWIQTVLSSDITLCNYPLINSSNSCGTFSSIVSLWN